MAYVVRPLPVGARGFDTIGTITTAVATSAAADGNKFVMRYAKSVTAEEVAAITDSGQGVGFVSYGRAGDFSSTTGLEDAQQLLDHLHGTLALPTGFTMGVDLEDPKGATLADLQAYEAAFAGGVVKAQDTSGVYVGAGLGMTSAELYALKATRYWKSGSEVRDSQGNASEPACGWCLYQGYPFDQVAYGTRLDYDFAQNDWHGRAWWALYAIATGTTYSIPVPSSAVSDTTPPPPPDSTDPPPQAA